MRVVPSAFPEPRRRLRVLVSALCYYPERRTGSSRLAYEEAKYLASLGHEVWLVAMDDGSGRPEHVVEDGVSVLVYRRPRTSGVSLTGVHRRAACRVLACHVPLPVDVVHCHVPLTGAAALQLYGVAARTCYSLHSPVRAEFFAMQRGAGPVERFRLRVAAAMRSRLERRLLESCDVITCDSAYTRRLVSELHHPNLGARMEVVPPWVDLRRFTIARDPAAARRALGWPLDRSVLFCLRRHVPRMGLDRLIAAAALVRSSGRDFHLVVGGTGPLRGRLEAQARSLGVSDRVQFAGVIADEVLPLAYGGADAFVLPTAALECFGLIAIEALACGTPVLATPVGAIPEVVGALEPRWLSEDASTRAIAALLCNFLDGNLPRFDAAFLRDYVERRYSASLRLPELAALALGERLAQEDRLWRCCES